MIFKIYNSKNKNLFKIGMSLKNLRIGVKKIKQFLLETKEHVVVAMHSLVLMFYQV